MKDSPPKPSKESQKKLLIEMMREDEKNGMYERTAEENFSDKGMDKLMIYRFQAKTIENALRLAMNVLDSRNKENETAMDRELFRADKFIKETLTRSPVESKSEGEKLAHSFSAWCWGKVIPIDIMEMEKFFLRFLKETKRI